MIDLNNLVTRDVTGLTVQEIKQLITDETTVGIVKPVHVRIKILKLIYQLLGFDLNKELLYMLASEPRAQLVLATAGAGKTTSTQLKLIAEKIYRTSPSTGEPLSGGRILCLVYNTHNVPDMKRKHKSLVNKLYSVGLEGLEIDGDIKAATMHSFCKEWLDEFAVKSGFVGMKLLEEDGAASLMEQVIKVGSMKFNVDPEKVKVKDVLSLYNYAKESLLESEELHKVDKFIDCGLEPAFLDMLFETYDKMKSLKNKFDYTDMILKFYHLLQTEDDVRNRIQSYYEYVTVDEVQDFTTVMNRIVKLIVGPNTPLVCIGDEDQSIYNFKGADIYSTLNFKEEYEGGEVYTLGINRRCAEKIVDASKYILKDNILRYQKKITAKRSGGEVYIKPYTSKQGQLINVVKEIMAMPYEEQQDTVICYRDRKSSLAIGSLLEEKGVPFYILSGYNCFKHELFKHVTEVLEVLYMENDQDSMKALYKCTPARKEQIFNVIGYNPKKRELKRFSQPQNFYNLNYGELTKSLPFVKALDRLKQMSLNIEKAPLNTYFPELFKMICRYFWNYKMSLNKEEAIDNYFTETVFNMFNVPLTYKQFRRDISRRKEIVQTNDALKNGVALSTFHKLKGLEFKNVFIIDAAEDIFPNYAGIEAKGYPDDVELKLKEAETRLMYVAMTRAKDKLTIYYDEYCPSLYIDKLNNFLNSSEDDILADVKLNAPKNNTPTSINSNNLFVGMLDRFK